MSDPSQERAFLALAAGLADFRGELTGDAGRKVAQMGPAQGALPDLVRETLGGIDQLLQWLDEGVEELEGLALQTDGAIATLETAADMLQSLGGIDAEAFPEEIEALGSVVETAGDALAEVGGVLDGLLDKLDILPTPDDCRAIAGELDYVYGRKDDGELVPPRTLPSLIEEITP